MSTLRQLFELLPVGLTVRNVDGSVLLTNCGEIANRGASTGWNVPAAKVGETTAVEEQVVGAGPERTLLTSYRAVQVEGQTLLVSASVDISEQKRVERELVRRAFFDDLTGLPNRIYIQQHLDEAIRDRAPTRQFALAFVDLDNFKHINDYYGHAVGDEFLVKIAQRMTAHIRPSDVFARISGDEFLLIIDPVDSIAQLQGMMDRLREEFVKPFYVDRLEVFTSASFGVSVYPEHGESYEELRRNADKAMYKVKSGAKGSALLYDRDMGEQVSARMAMEQKLRLAICDRQFLCAFQPKVNIDGDKVVGFEALLRFRDEDGVIQAPANFISLATELGLIDPITRFALAEAHNALDRLDETFGGGTTMSINVAARQVGNLKFMQSFTEALEETGRADRFMIEITEDAVIQGDDFRVKVLPKLREMGVRISIDDFGTGYSSLSALADIAADELKVDRSLITQIHDRPRSQSVLKAIESLSSALGVRIVAEGVETADELAYLKSETQIRCVQGFYFSKPFLLEDAASANDFAGSRCVPASARKWSQRAAPSPVPAVGGFRFR